ncbi:MAG: ATP-binding cassette domain-containing protein [Syntrophales bacterium]
MARTFKVVRPQQRMSTLDNIVASAFVRTKSKAEAGKAGAIHFIDIPIHKMEPHKPIGIGLVHVPEARRLFVEMSVEENLDMGSLKGEAKKEREVTKELVFKLFPRLLERRRPLSVTISGGEQHLLAIKRRLMSKPKLQMFDEPSLGLSPILVKDIFNVIKKIKKEGTTVLIVEQNMNQTLAIADRAYLLENGKKALEGTAAELLNNEHVRTAYLGVQKCQAWPFTMQCRRKRLQSHCPSFDLINPIKSITDFITPLNKGECFHKSSSL